MHFAFTWLKFISHLSGITFLMYVALLLFLSICMCIYVQCIIDSYINNMAMAVAAVQRAVDLDDAVAVLISQEKSVCCVAWNPSFPFLMFARPCSESVVMSRPLARVCGMYCPWRYVLIVDPLKNIVYYATHNILTSFEVDQPCPPPAYLVNENGMGVQSVRWGLPRHTDLHERKTVWETERERERERGERNPMIDTKM